MTFPFFLIDAFSSVPLQGNPCAVVLDAESLSEEEMLRITREMNQSETAFLSRASDVDFRARYFTPEKEIPLAGHPTLASVHAALEAGWISLGKGRFRIGLKDGPIHVDVETVDGRRWIRMEQRKPSFHETHDPDVVLPMFGLSRGDLFPGSVIQTVSTGTRQLMALVRSQESLRRLKMNAEAYRAYRDRMNFFSPHFFCLQGISADAATFARHPGLLFEDAFTGSSTGGMAAFLWKYGFLNSPRFIAEQGHWMGRPGRALVDVRGPREDIESVSVAGETVTVVRGTLNLP